MIAGLNLTSTHRDILMLMWLSDKEVSLNDVNEAIYPDKINETMMYKIIEDLKLSGLLLQNNKANLELLRNNIFSDKEEIPPYKLKDSGIYKTFHECFGIHISPSYMLESKIKNILLTGKKIEDIREAIVYASTVKWLANHTDKSWFGLMWLLCKIDDFSIGGKYREGNREQINKGDDDDNIDIGL